MTPSVTSRAGVLEGEVQVLEGHLPNGGMLAGVEGGVVQVPLSAHHSVGPRSLQTPLHIGEVLDVPVG